MQAMNIRRLLRTTFQKSLKFRILERFPQTVWIIRTLYTLLQPLWKTAIANADARAINDAVGILATLLPGRPLSVMVGDQAVFEAVVKTLGLPSGWQKRLIQAFGDSAHLDQLLLKLSS